MKVSVSAEKLKGWIRTYIVSGLLFAIPTLTVEVIREPTATAALCNGCDEHGHPDDSHDA